MHPKRTANPTAKCPRVSDKDLRAMVKAAWTAGWWCSKQPRGHVKCYPPTGKMVIVSNTPSDHHTIPNTRAAFRRQGLMI
jgi:hypothetical protein